MPGTASLHLPENTERGLVVSVGHGRSKGRPEVLVKKVQGHAGPGHLADGTASIDVWGNGAADWIAQYAARNCNELPTTCQHAWYVKPS